MRSLMIVIAALLPVAALAADEQSAADFAAYEEKHQYACNAPMEGMATPEVREHAGFRYELGGGTVKIRHVEKRKGSLRIGVLSAIKDAEPETLALIERFLGDFEKHLEAGARATDLNGKPLKPGKPYASLFLNPGSANPLPWKLNTLLAVTSADSDHTGALAAGVPGQRAAEEWSRELRHDHK